MSREAVSRVRPTRDPWFPHRPPGLRAAELQADCFAGATLFGAADLGLTFERGDTEELATALAAAADDHPWTTETDQGDAQQRTASFQDGAQGGPTACTR